MTDIHETPAVQMARLRSEIASLTERVGDPRADTPANAYWRKRLEIAQAENERLRAALLTEPVLTTEQEEELTGVHFSAILPRIEIFKLGWRTALGHIRRSLANEQSPQEGK